MTHDRGPQVRPAGLYTRAVERGNMDSRVLLFYKFAPLSDPEAIKLWQLELCTRLNMRGRIIVSPHGINGTVSGSVKDAKAYVKALRSYAPFKDVDMKQSAGLGLYEDGTTKDFPRLSVKNRKEIVAFGAPDELKVGPDGVIGGGTHVKPDQVEDLIKEHPDLLFFDGRNEVEAEVGQFEGAIVPPTKTTHDFISALESGEYDDIKDKPILTYCTGGIRCEVLSALMKNRGFSNVYQLDGGIVRYGEKYGNTGRWKGSLVVFDGREVVDLGPDAEVIGHCHKCDGPTSTLHNCDEPSCRERMVTCSECATSVYCPDHTPVGAQG